jgi:glycosyltransferase involved in cell wall biosynthesis
MARICILPRASNVGGVTSFQAKLSQGLELNGHQVSFDLEKYRYDAVLLTGGVRSLAALRKARRQGARIVQRLDGINWLHHRVKTGARHYLRSEYGNRLLALLRARFVDRIVYQSEFVRQWWNERFGRQTIPNEVIHNGVDLVTFSPNGTNQRPKDRFRILLVEGSLQGGYENGLDTAVELAEVLGSTLSIELMVAGQVSKETRNAENVKAKFRLSWAGLVPHELIPELDRSAHLLFSADINAACPNSVIEALACGLPIAAFSTGALPELVSGDSGRLVPYGGDPWKLDKPDIPALSQAVIQVLQNQDRFRTAARQRAESAFGLDKMVQRYQDVLLR